MIKKILESKTIEDELKDKLEKDVQIPGYGTLKLKYLIDKIKDLQKEICSKQLNSFTLPRFENATFTLNKFLKILEDIDKYIVE